jgi:hypothetical protein
MGGPVTAEDKGDRVVLGQRTPNAMVAFQWTGAEPPGLSDTRLAEMIGAVWEDGELVTYNYRQFLHSYGHWADEFLEDDD